jgi:hypothetical protein
LSAPFLKERAKDIVEDAIDEDSEMLLPGFLSFPTENLRIIPRHSLKKL